jgi:hypothetical protein
MPVHNQVIPAHGVPVINVEIGVTTVLAQKLGAEGKPLPSSISGLALIDTGASISAVCEEAIAKLGIEQSGETKIMTPSQDDGVAPVYSVRMTFPQTGIVVVLDGQFPMAGAKLQKQGLLALIGRDILQHMILVYNGPGKFFSLSY